MAQLFYFKEMLSLEEKENLKTEIQFSFARSSGSGGQHVNKTNTKVILHWDFVKSDAFIEKKKNILLPKLLIKYPSGRLFLTVEETRSQLQNKELAVNKLFHLLNKLLFVKSLRKKVKIKKSVVENRLVQKKKLSFIKISRKKPSSGNNE